MRGRAPSRAGLLPKPCQLAGRRASQPLPRSPGQSRDFPAVVCRSRYPSSPYGRSPCRGLPVLPNDWLFHQPSHSPSSKNVEPASVFDLKRRPSPSLGMHPQRRSTEWSCTPSLPGGGGIGCDAAWFAAVEDPSAMPEKHTAGDGILGFRGYVLGGATVCPTQSLWGKRTFFPAIGWGLFRAQSRRVMAVRPI